MSSKKVVITWDFDGPIGIINASYPYNFHYSNLEREINNAKAILDILDEYDVKSCFAITGFSAEEGKYPYTFPEFINEIFERGHEVASHSWRHEWSSIFQLNQIDKSLKRSKESLKMAINHKQEIYGFVPPHNRPMTWLRRGAFSWGDRGVYPFFKAADNESIINLLKKNNYKWLRVSYKNIFQKIRLQSRNITGRIHHYKGIMLLENHHTGFGKKVTKHILETNYETYILSAHPLMFDFKDKTENKENFIYLLDTLKNSTQDIEFVRPIDLLNMYKGGN
ncbi:MAG: polysaccharide deacetylase family protein [Nonlabens sp.]